MSDYSPVIRNLAGLLALDLLLLVALLGARLVHGQSAIIVIFLIHIQLVAPAHACLHISDIIPCSTNLYNTSSRARAAAPCHPFGPGLVHCQSSIFILRLAIRLLTPALVMLAKIIAVPQIAASLEE